MRFLLKAVFWFTLVVLVMPKTGDQDPTVDVGDNSDGAVQNRLTVLCRDYPGACRQTAIALSDLDIRSDDDARLALKILMRAAGSPSDRTD